MTPRIGAVAEHGAKMDWQLSSSGEVEAAR
jgi:hypothetical protein